MKPAFICVQHTRPSMRRWRGEPETDGAIRIWVGVRRMSGCYGSKRNTSKRKLGKWGHTRHNIAESRHGRSCCRSASAFGVDPRACGQGPPVVRSGALAQLSRPGPNHRGGPAQLCGARNDDAGKASHLTPLSGKCVGGMFRICPLRSMGRPIIVRVPSFRRQSAAS